MFSFEAWVRVVVLVVYPKAADVVKLMDAFGMDIVIIETVGVGQSEVDIVKMQILHWLYLFQVSVMISKLLKRVFLKSAMYLLSIKLTEMVAIV